MSIELLNIAIHKTKGLKPTEKLILIILANYADEKGSCYPSLKHIAEICGLKDTKNIRKILKDFEAKGLIQIESRKKQDGGNLSNRYHLRIEGCVDTDPPKRTPHPTGTETPPIGVPTPPNTKEDTKEDNNNFEEFWNLYPRKVGKHKAKEKYQKAMKETTHKELMKLTWRFAEETRFEKTEEKFILHCATYLNQRRYLDYQSDDYKKKMKTNLNAIAG